MKIHYNPSCFSDKLLEDAIQTQSSLVLESESNTYVVFDGTAKILWEGTLDVCYVYQMEYKRAMGFTPSIYSIEGYNQMMSTRNNK